VLKRKLPGEGAAALTPPSPASPKAIAPVAVPPSVAAAQPQHVERAAVTPSAPPPATHAAAAAAASEHAPKVAAKVPEPRHAAPPAATRHPATAEAHGRYAVQAATMSTLDRAKKVASAIGGSVSKAGKYYRVHTGPFATRKQAEASLAKVRAAGYSDARIFTNG
jgi:rare lipoprotein A